MMIRYRLVPLLAAALTAVSMPAWSQTATDQNLARHNAVAWAAVAAASQAKVSWTRLESDVRLSDFAAGPKGTVYGLERTYGATANPLGDRILKWNPSSRRWDTLPGLAKKITVGDDGELWALNGQGSLYRSTNDGATWKQELTGIVDVSSGACTWVIQEGGEFGKALLFLPRGATQWVNTTDNLSYSSNFGGLSKVGLKFLKQVVDGGVPGQAYAFNTKGAAFFRFTQATSMNGDWGSFREGPSVQNIARAANGRLYGVTTAPTSDGAADFKLTMYVVDEIYKWRQVPGSAVKLIVANSQLWAQTAAGELYVTPLPTL